jgi:hypothetical protein
LDLIDSRDPMRHVDHLIAALDSKDAVVAFLQSEGWTTWLSVFWGFKSNQGGPWLTPFAMGRLSALKIPIDYEVYYEGGGIFPMRGEDYVDNAIQELETLMVDLEDEMDTYQSQERFEMVLASIRRQIGESVERLKGLTPRER